MAQPKLQGAARFHLEREISDTLQGRVYAATDFVTNQPCIIKQAWRQLVLSGRSRKGYRVPEDFLEERRIIMELSTLSNVAPGYVPN